MKAIVAGVGALAALLVALPLAVTRSQSATTGCSTGWQTALPPAAQPYIAYVTSAGADNNVDPILLAAIVTNESGWNPGAHSPAGANGLAQVLNGPFDPAANLEAGAHILADDLQALDANVTLAVAAYNAGLGAVLRYGGIPPFAETEAYVPKVLATAQTLLAASTPCAVTTAAPQPGVASGNVVQLALAYQGVPYLWGGTTPAGWDCSGFVQWLWKQAGIDIPRTTWAQWAALTPIDPTQAQPGDLVFFDGSDGPIGHVGLYLGNGMMIDAPHTRAVTRIEPVWLPYRGFRRVVA